MIGGGGAGLIAKSCLTLGDPMNWSPPGSSAHGISQAGILEGVAISFSIEFITIIQFTEGSEDGYHFLAIKYFFIKMCTLLLLFFSRDNAIAHLIDCSLTETTFPCTGKPKYSCDFCSHFIHANLL